MNNTPSGFSGQWAGPGPTLPIDFAPARGRIGAEVTVTSCDGHAFVVRRSGHGAPVFLLHDMAETQGAWDAVRGTLSWSNTICTWDARGHGASRGTPESAVPTLDLLAADLDAAVAACAPEDAVLVGHGLGALTVLEYLRNYGDERVSGAVLVDQSPRMLTMPDWSLGLFGGFPAGDEMGFESRIRADFAGAWSALQARAAAASVHGDSDAHSRHGGSHHDLGGLAAGSMLALWRSMTGRDYRADLAALRLPLLVVLGGGSLYDTEQLGRWFHTAVPLAKVVRYLKADHAPHVAAPARFARDVAAFAAPRETTTSTPSAAIPGAVGNAYVAAVHAAA